jgi:DNA-binding LytR/AlgR family response regulator
MKIAICDDEELCREQIHVIAAQYTMERTDIRPVFSFFSHADDLLEEAERIGGFDIYILDIVMPDTNGIQLGVKLRDLGYDGKIIYLTSSEEYALDSFKVRALNYIIKPITKEIFYATVDEAAALHLNKKETCILVKTKERSIKLPLHSIVYAESGKRTVIYYLTNGSTVETTTRRTSFSESIAELLADPRFALGSSSTVVNLDHVTSVDAESVECGDTYRIFLGKRACREFRLIWSKYLFSGEGI